MVHGLANWGAAVRGEGRAGVIADCHDSIQLAAHAGAEVKCADQLTNVAKLQALEEIQPGAFSACTFTIDDRHVIVYSPLASPGRRQSDIAHEVAHLLLGHAVKIIQQVGGLSFFTCDPDEEQEANWLAGCLLLPRQLLYAAARRGYGAADNRSQHVMSAPSSNWLARDC
jgi:Zn-dependent peptidase ImmA (M78 family)